MDNNNNYHPFDHVVDDLILYICIVSRLDAKSISRWQRTSQRFNRLFSPVNTRQLFQSNGAFTWSIACCQGKFHGSVPFNIKSIRLPYTITHDYSRLFIEKTNCVIWAAGETKQIGCAHLGTLDILWLSYPFPKEEEIDYFHIRVDRKRDWICLFNTKATVIHILDLSTGKHLSRVNINIPPPPLDYNPEEIYYHKNNNTLCDFLITCDGSYYITTHWGSAHRFSFTDNYTISEWIEFEFMFEASVKGPYLLSYGKVAKTLMGVDGLRINTPSPLTRKLVELNGEGYFVNDDNNNTHYVTRSDVLLLRDPEQGAYAVEFHPQGNGRELVTDVLGLRLGDFGGCRSVYIGKDANIVLVESLDFQLCYYKKSPSTGKYESFGFHNELLPDDDESDDHGHCFNRDTGTYWTWRKWSSQPFVIEIAKIMPGESQPVIYKIKNNPPVLHESTICYIDSNDTIYILCEEVSYVFTLPERSDSELPEGTTFIRRGLGITYE